MGEEGGVGSPTFQNAILAISSGYALSVSQTPYASVGYGLFLVKGIVGVIKKLVNEGDLDNLSDLLEYTSRAVGIPLMAADMCINSGLPWEISSLQLVVPALDMGCHYLTDKDLEPKLIDLSRLISVIMVAWKSFETGGQMGFAFALTDFVAEVGSKDNNIPDISVLMGACCVFCAYFMIGKKNIF